MFIAASTRSFSDKPFVEACGLIGHLEFDKVEIWLNEEGVSLKPSEIVNDCDGVITRFRQSGRLTAVAIHLEHDVDSATFDAVTQFAKLLKIAQITVPSAPAGTPFNSEVDRLREMCTVSGRDGIRVSIKTETGRLSEDPHTAVELCQSVKGLGVTLDPSYYICRNPQVSFEFMFPHVYHMHLRDTTASDLQVPLGLGEVDFARIFGQLEREDYKGALSIDLLPDESDDETRQLEMRKLRRLLESLL